MDFDNKYIDEEIISKLAALLTLEEDTFAALSPHILDAIEEGLNNEEYKRECAKGLRENYITKDGLEKEMNEVFTTVDEELADYSEQKREFMKQFYGKVYNSIISLLDKNQRAIHIPIELCNPDAKVPTYAHEGDAGMDVYSPIDVTLAPGETKIIPLGFKAAIPVGYELQVRPRSGLSSRTHLRVANAPGTIDSGYRGEVGVILHNSAAPLIDIGDNDTPRDGVLYGPTYEISKGDRIAQLVLQEVPTAMFVETSDISKIGVDRGGGYGSSGK